MTAVLDIYVHDSCQRSGIGKVVKFVFRKYLKNFLRRKTE